MPIFSAGSASVSVVPDFSGAQRAITEFFAAQKDVKVKVTPDLADGDVARTEAELNAMRGTATVTVDKNALSSSIADGIKVALATSGLDRLGSILSAAIGPAVVTTIAGAFTELAAVASQAVGVIALMPAALAAVTVPAATLLLGFQGVGTAITDAFDPKKAAQFQAAMDKLAPSAQGLVREIIALKPAWDAMQLDVQQRLFVGVGTAVSNLATVALPILHAGLAATASALNTGLLATMTALQGQGVNFSTIFTNVATTVRTLAGAAAPLIQAFLTLASVGSQFLPQLAQGFVNVATAFNNWIQHIAATGQLVTIIQNAINVITELGRLAVNVGSILGGIFTAAVGPGGILLGLLVQVTGQLGAFVHSADGQSALQSFFTSIQVALGTLLPALSVLVQAIVTAVLPALGQFAALLAPIAGQLLTELASVLLQVGAILPPVAQVMAALVSATAPLIPVIGQLITTLLPPLVKIFGDLAPIISQVATILGQALLGAAKAIAPVLPLIGAAFIAILQALLPLLPALTSIAVQLLPPLLNVVTALVPIVQSAVQVFAAIAGVFLQIASATVLPLVVSLLNSFAAGLQVLSPILGPLVGIILAIVAAMKLWAAIQAVLDVALDANPIGLLVVAIAGLIVVLGEVITHWKAISDFLTGVWNAVVDFVIAHWKLLLAALPGIGPIILAIITIVQNFQAIWTTVLGALQTALSAFLGWWNGFWGGIVSGYHTTIDGLVTWFQLTVGGWIQGAQNLWNGFLSWWNGFWAGVVSAYHAVIDGLVTWFQLTVGGWIQGAQNLWNGFLSWWNGFWAGVVSAYHTTIDALVAWFQTTVAGWITGAQNLWNNFLNWWNGFWAGVVNGYHALIDALVAWFHLTVSSWIQDTLNLWNNFLSWWNGFWSGVVNGYHALIDALVAWFHLTVSSWIQDTLNLWNNFLSWWNGFWSGIVNGYHAVIDGLVAWFHLTVSGWIQDGENLWNGFLGWWNPFWDSVSSKFSTIWNGIKGFAQQVWSDIKAIIAVPINFVIGTILNGGLFKAWNAVNDFLHLPFHINNLPLIPGYYTGGYTGEAGMFGTDGPGDPAGVVHAKEFVFTANQVANAGGPAAMYGLASHLDSGYAQGGLVRKQASDPQVGVNSYVVPPTIAPRIARFLDALSTGQAEAVQAAGGFDALGPGFFWGGYADAITAGKAFAQAQNGKPYIWGGVGPAGYDCSGFQSAITNVLRGSANPYSRVGSTANFPWAGFTPGLTSAYGIGSTKDAGGGIGHMAGTLAGINAEAGGGHGNVAFGGPAAGALASLFNIHASLPQVGGAFAGGGGGGGGGGTTPLSILGNLISGAGDVLTMLTNSIAGPVKDLLGMGQGGSWLSILAELPKTLLGGLWDKVKDAVGSAIGSALSAVNPANPAFNVATTGSIQSQVQSAAHAFRPGWETGAEWAGIDYIVSHESGWNPKAQNPTSTASGLFQEIDGTWAAYRPPNASQYAHAKDAPVADQAMGGLNYISSRYGDPIAAQKHWVANHSYDSGGWLPPGFTTVHNGTGNFEAVLNAAQQQSMGEAVMGNRGPTQFTGNLYLDSGEFMGKVHGVAVDVVNSGNGYTSRTVRSSM